MEHFFYNFSPGADVFNSLNKLQKDFKSTSFLISAVGDLSRGSFKCPLSQKPVILENKLEIITLSGYLTSKDSHIHISVSDENCRVFGGHLLPGTIVLKTLDILLGVIPNLQHSSLDSINDIATSIDIYVLPNCPWSKKAIKLLDSYHINYNYYLISSDDEFKKIKDRTNINTFPQIFIRNKFIGGFSELLDLSSNGNLVKLIS